VQTLQLDLYEVDKYSQGVGDPIRMTKPADRWLVMQNPKATMMIVSANHLSAKHETLKNHWDKSTIECRAKCIHWILLVPSGIQMILLWHLTKEVLKSTLRV
jgi:hypothetical protein